MNAKTLAYILENAFCTWSSGQCQAYF